MTPIGLLRVLVLFLGACVTDAGPLPCQPSAMASQESCEGTGGTFVTEGGLCVCPTTDAMEPCTDSRSCEDRCVNLAGMDCLTATTGVCTSFRSVVGCACTLVGGRGQLYCGAAEYIYADL